MLLVDEAQVVVRVLILRVEPDCQFVLCDCRIGAVLVIVDEPQTEVRFGIIRIRVHRFVILDGSVDQVVGVIEVVAVLYVQGRVLGIGAGRRLGRTGEIEVAVDRRAIEPRLLGFFRVQRHAHADTVEHLENIESRFRDRRCERGGIGTVGAGTVLRDVVGLRCE